jgi:hypothetical protein
MAVQAYFQWQNEVLRQAIYPRREMKLADFLVFYKEIDLWAEYKSKDITSLQAEYLAAQQKATSEAYRNYCTRKAYFLKPDVRADYLGKPLDEGELAQVNTLHSSFVSSFKYKDVRKEKYFVSDRIYEWELHRNEAQRLVKAKERRISIMQEQVPPNPNIPKEITQLKGLQAALDMAQRELDKLVAFLGSFEKIEKRKLELFQAQDNAQRGKAQLAPRLTDLNDQIGQAKRKGSDPQKIAPVQAELSQLQAQIAAFDATINTPEEAYVAKYVPAGPLGPGEIVAWKMEEYKKLLAAKNHDQLVEEVVQRFTSQPERYPLWLQYMVIHFSGMRYASAHGSWADPKDMLFGLRTANLAKDLKALDEGSIAAMCEQAKVQYGIIPPSTGTRGIVPKLASSSDPEWKQKIFYHLRGLSSPSPSTRLNALINLRTEEENYEVEMMSPDQALEELKSYKDKLPEWAWKEIAAHTQLRTTEAIDANWDKLTDAELQARYSAEDAQFRQLLDKWETADITGWREEHAQSHQLIVTRAVCNEVAEHIQHLRGHTPPGGLTPKAPWYKKNEEENKLPGDPRPYFRKAAVKEDYIPGASILWLRFMEKQPNPWQAAHLITSKAGDGLLPPGFLRQKAGTGWTYMMTDPITRKRIVMGAKGAKVPQLQYLRWVHEATVVEVAETAGGWVVLTFEPMLPYEDRRVSSIGVFKHDVKEILQEGDEENYNRSFIGFVPEGRIPAADLEGMLDWNKILRRPFMAADNLEEYRRKYIWKA